MKRRNYQKFKIDKLTNSIENTVTGEIFDTEVEFLRKSHLKYVKKKDWRFNWKGEFLKNTGGIYKLTTKKNYKIIHGLMSIEDKGDHIFIYLLENAKHNIGKKKLYLGVAGNLVSFACKISLEKGYNGFVAFDSKTSLINHYKKTLGAINLSGRRMYLDARAAKKLIEKYFKNLDL